MRGPCLGPPSAMAEQRICSAGCDTPVVGLRPALLELLGLKGSEAGNFVAMSGHPSRLAHHDACSLTQDIANNNSCSSTLQNSQFVRASMCSEVCALTLG